MLYFTTGNCLTDVASDVCDKNSIPLRCGNRRSDGFVVPPSCLCKEGYAPSDTCVGKYVPESIGGGGGGGGGGGYRDKM